MKNKIKIKKLKEYRRIFNISKYASLIAGIFAFPLFILFYLFLFTNFNAFFGMQLIYDLFHYLFLGSLIVSFIGYIFFGKQLGKKSIVIFGILYVILSLPFIDLIINNLFFSVFSSEIVLLIFSIILFLNSSQFKILKPLGIVGGSCSILNIVLMAIFLTIENLPLIAEILVAFGILLSIVLFPLFFILQYKFFASLQKNEK